MCVSMFFRERERERERERDKTMRVNEKWRPSERASSHSTLIILHSQLKLSRLRET